MFEKTNKTIPLNILKIKKKKKKYDQLIFLKNN